MTYLLQHMLPNAPRESSALIAASNAGVPGILQNHLSQGTDLSSACRLTAAAFENQTALAPDACHWAVGALASALRVQAGDSKPGSAWEAAPDGDYQQTMAATGPGAGPGAPARGEPRASERAQAGSRGRRGCRGGPDRLGLRAPDSACTRRQWPGFYFHIQ